MRGFGEKVDGEGIPTSTPSDRDLKLLGSEQHDLALNAMGMNDINVYKACMRHSVYAVWIRRVFFHTNLPFHTTLSAHKYSNQSDNMAG
jgi:hypothetical protein